MFLLQSNRYPGNFLNDHQILGSYVDQLQEFQLYFCNRLWSKKDPCLVYGIAVAVIVLRMFGLPQRLFHLILMMLWVGCNKLIDGLTTVAITVAREAFHAEVLSYLKYVM